jgi:ribosomal protein L11 methylase PrmA
MNSRDLPGSFRDPSGAVFLRDGVIYRRVHAVYQADYDHLMGSGLYQALVTHRLLVPHEEAPADDSHPAEVYRILQPEPIPFISFPYEWCFSQLKDAALATLRIQELALDHGMCLKDASAYNIQFRDGRPILIDTLSFERLRVGEPWVAYRQFCRHFLAPLVLMARADVRLGRLLPSFIDGLPLDLASRLAPWRTRLNPGLYLHLHLHARMEQRLADRPGGACHRPVSPNALRGLTSSLQSTVARLRWNPPATAWGDYHPQTSYSAAAAASKREIVTGFVRQVAPRNVWDVGANAGDYSRIASDGGIPTLAFDFDPAAVEKNYLDVRRNKETRLLPLLLDLANPSPAIGWANQERESLLARGPADMALALAIIHHLALSNNVPLGALAEFFATLCRWLVIEFVPKDDPQVQGMLAWREDVFPDYTEEAVRREFSRRFTIESSQPIADSPRTLHLMRRRDP